MTDTRWPSEREMIVAFIRKLREESLRQSGCSEDNSGALVLAKLADAIERGGHLHDWAEANGPRRESP